MKTFVCVFQEYDNCSVVVIKANNIVEAEIKLQETKFEDKTTLINAKSDNWIITEITEDITVCL
jgi:hypothetical protein